MIVYLDDINYTSDIDGLENLQITENFRNSSGQPDKQITSNLIFKDDAAEYIKDKLILGDCWKTAYIEVKFYDDCCGGLVMEGVLRGDAINWNNENCIITGRVIQSDEITEAYRIIRSTLIYEGITGDDKPTIPAIKEPTGGAFGLGIFTPIVTGHPTFFVRQYLQNIADHAGLTLQCSIFNNLDSPYYNAVYLPPIIEPGIDPTPDLTLWIEDNAPLTNGAQFMDSLKFLFNTEWRVKGDRLILERRDFFKSDETWITYTALDKRTEINYSFLPEKKYAYMNFSYTEDSLETDGNRGLGLERKMYSDIVEWNEPVSILQESEFNITAPFGAVNFTGDSLDETATNPLGVFDEFAVLAMTKGYSQLPKIFIINGLTDGTAARDYTGALLSGVPTTQSHNFPMWFNADIPDTFNAEYEGDTLVMNPEYGELYRNFWYIDDPRREDVECREAVFTFGFDCDDLDSYDISKGVDIYGQTGRIDKIVFNYGTRTAEVTVAL